MFVQQMVQGGTAGSSTMGRHGSTILGGEMTAHNWYVLAECQT